MTNKPIGLKPKRKKPLSVHLRLSLFALMILFLLVPSITFFWLSWQESTQTKIIHFLVDDYSQSARNVKAVDDLAYEHCKYSSNLYLEGDTRIVIAFANRPEVVSQKSLSRSYAPGIPLVSCKQNTKPSDQVGNQVGTSLTDIINYVKILIENEKRKNAQVSIVVTITIEYAEMDLDIAEIKKDKLLHIREVISSTVNDGSVFFVLLGPVGELQKDLNASIGNINNVKICSKNDVKQCVEDVFSSARKKIRS